jgi:hypothetical protein
MTRLKNLTRSVLLVPDAKLRLAPGEAADVPELTPQCLAALRSGVATKLEPPEEEDAAFVREEVPASTATPAEPPPRAPRKREAKEPAEGVDALKARLAEVSVAGP